MKTSASLQHLEFDILGTRPLRHDGVDKVTGKALYGIDAALPGMLFGAVLRSPHAHARILSIDTQAAERLPGVKAVVTSADLPDIESKIAQLGEGSTNLRYQSANILARDKVLYYGHAVAAVAASSPHLAQQALELIRVEYEVLQPVLDVRRAMEADAPILLEDLRTNDAGKKGGQPSNIAAIERTLRGDIEQGFRDAAVIVEREFNTASVHQGYIEPQNALALYNQDGRLTVWCSTQGAFGVRDQLAEILGIPLSQIRVVPMEIGGGFGGKISVYLEPVAAVLSKKAGCRPVKMTMSYAEVLSATGPTSGSYIRVKMGANREGRITAAYAYLAYEAGAFPGSPLWGAMGVIFSPYNIPNVLIEGYDVVVNKPQTSAYRAPGGTNAAFAAESVVDELSQELGIDPLQFRLRNCVREGDRRADGLPFQQIGCAQILETALRSEHYHAPLRPNQGRGVALGYWGNGGGRSSAAASLNADGTVNLIEGSTDIGGSRTAIAMQLAETLGIPAEDVHPHVGDTDSVGYTEGTYGSRTTFATGWAVYELGKALIENLCKRAADLWDVDAAMVAFERGVFTCGEDRLTLKELAARLNAEGQTAVASASVNAQNTGPAFALHIVDVEVDPETAKVDILRYTAIQDVGKAVHPAYVEGQMQGGAAQGIGWALSEGYEYDQDGRLLNNNLLDYRIMTALDLPRIDTILVEVPNPSHPYGVRGVGEAPIVPPAGALANAIHRAAGVRLRRLPMSPPRILEALLER